MTKNTKRRVMARSLRARPEAKRRLERVDDRALPRAEEQLWTRFVRDGVLDQVTALRYLQALTNRPHTRIPSRDAFTEVPVPREPAAD